MQISKGYIVVHSGFSLENSVTTEIKIISENQKDRVRLVVHSYTGSILYETSGKATDEIIFGERFAAGTYIVKVNQAGQTVEKVVIKM